MVPAIIIGILGLATAGAGVAQQVIAGDQAKDECKKGCKDICKAKHKALFDGRQKCITKCEADCVIQGNQPLPPPPPSGLDAINWWYVAGGTILTIAIFIYVLRK